MNSLLKRKIFLLSILLLSSLVILAACSPTIPSQLAAATATNAPVDVAAAHGTATEPAQTAAALETRQPAQAASLASTPTPVAAFDDHAPAWLVTCLLGESEGRVVAYNPDGSAFKDLLPAPVDSSFCQVAATPVGKGGLVAVVTAPVEEGHFPSQLNLSIIQLPEGRVIQALNLLNPEKIKDAAQGVPNMMVLEAVGFNNGMSWSPDGRTLAVIAALDGPSADVYLYDAQSGQLARASQEPDQASGLSWSPDGRFVLYQQIEAFGGGGAVAKGVWAVDAAARTDRRLLDTGAAPMVFDGWTEDGQLITHPWGGTLLEADFRGKSSWLQLIDPQTGAVVDLLPPGRLPTGAHIQPAYNPGDGWIGVALEYSADVKLDQALDGTLNKSVTWGPEQFWAVPLDGSAPKFLFSQVSARGIGIDINPAGRPGHWIARFERERFDLSLNGRGPALDQAWFAPEVSPDGRWLAFYVVDTNLAGYRPGLRLVAAGGTAKHEITQTPVSSVVWRPDGEGLLFISNEALFYLPRGSETPIQMQAGVFAYLFSNNLSSFDWVTP